MSERRFNKTKKLLAEMQGLFFCEKENTKVFLQEVK